MLSRLLAISIVIICIPLSLLLLWMWTIFAGSIVFAGDFQETLSEAYKAVLITPNPPLAFYIVRQLVGVFGGLIGWVSLVALVAVSQRPSSSIPTPIKIGCLIGVLSAITLPAAPGLSFPPILLCASLFWLAGKRDS